MMAQQEAMKILVSEWMEYYNVWMPALQEGKTPLEALGLLRSFA